MPKPEELVAALQRFGLERDRMRATLVSVARISATDLDALEHLEADGPLTQRQLGDRLSLTSGAITMLVDRLEEGGWVQRRAHPSDRRYVLVELSEQAIDRTPEGLIEYHVGVRRIAATIPEASREIILRFLQDTSLAASLASKTLRESN